MHLFKMMWLNFLFSLCKLLPFSEKTKCFSLVVAETGLKSGEGGEELRKKEACKPRRSSLTCTDDSFQCDMMRVSTPCCSPIKLEAAKCFTETLGGHSTTISNLNWPCDPTQVLWHNEITQCISSGTKKKINTPRLWMSWLNNDQMFLRSPFSQFKVNLATKHWAHLSQ